MVLPLKQGILYGPVNSRRLGLSLGINLSPRKYKSCSFNCVYCHYGWTDVQTMKTEDRASDIPRFDDVAEVVEEAAKSSIEFDYITFSGNGEPTLHPQFARLVREVRDIRDRHRPAAKVALLSNSTGLVNEDVRHSVDLIDLPVFKLDAGTEEKFRAINRPVKEMTLEKIVELLTSVDGIYIQTILVGGEPSNTEPEDIEAYYQRLARIRPIEAHIYSIDRPVPKMEISRVSPDRLNQIAAEATEKTGVTVRAFCELGRRR